MSNTSNNTAVQRWAAVKSAIVRERQRLLSEWSRARAIVLDECGQDISQIGKPLTIHDKPAIAFHCDGEISVAVGGGVMTGLCGLQPPDHWPGELRHWETVVSVLSKVNTETILSAWSKATE